MSVGIAMYGSDPTQLVPIARRADELGFDGLWLGEHVVLPEDMAEEHPYSAGRSTPAVLSADPRMYDIWTMIGALIAATRRVTVSTGIYLLPLRHPLVSARAAITAQQISGGRFMFGVAAGWLSSEYQALAVSFDDRGRRFDEILDLLPKLFAGGPVEHAGEFYAFPRLAFVRAPIRIPILMGGTKRPALRRAALKGDGWYGSSLPFEENIRIREEIERYRREFGRAKEPFLYYHRILGRPIAHNLEKFRAAGCENLIIPFDAIHPPTSSDLSTPAILRSLENVAKDIGLKAP